jgi:hypothetical protein
MILIQSITGERAHLGDMQGSAESWSADLELAKKVELAGVLPYIEILNKHQEIDGAISSLKRAASAAQLTKAQLQESDSALHAAIQHLDASPDPRKKLVALSESLKLTVPADLISNPATADHTDNNALRTEAFFAALRTRRNELAIRAERWPVVLEALSRYRSRLNQPFVDLQRAVLSEANVIGATCSGIAGTKDFDSDFDCVIVDEAGRTTPLDLLMPIVRGKSIVLVGDHKQLPPFVDEQLKEEMTDREKKLVDRSIFENIYESSHADRRQALRKQYRMAPRPSDGHLIGEIVIHSGFFFSQKGTPGLVEMSCFHVVIEEPLENYITRKGPSLRALSSNHQSRFPPYCWPARRVLSAAPESGDHQTS